ncbi:hypothetical protein, partial [Shigella sp. FC1967]|uniref:hypothetical protein n=1 Tax=Shigella sp. FC1967 TaxID=1898041 RepID=UPI001C0A6AEE
MNVFRFGGKAPRQAKRLTTTFLSDQIQGRKKGGWSDERSEFDGLGEWFFFSGVQPKKIARGRSLMSFIFVQKMSGIDTES